MQNTNLPRTARELAAVIGPRLTAEACNKLINRWRETLAPATAYQHETGLRRIISWLVSKHEQPDVTNELPQPRVPPPRTTIATDEQIAEAIAKATPPLKTVLLFCADCGLRSAEAVSIGPDNYNSAERTITFKGKGNVVRTLPVTERLGRWLDAAPERAATFAACYSAVSKYSQNSAHTAWQRLKRKLGIPLDLRFHDLRRTLATKAYRETKDLFVVKQLLGHKDLLSTLSYIAPHDTPELQPLLEQLKAETPRRKR